MTDQHSPINNDQSPLTTGHWLQTKHQRPITNDQPSMIPQSDPCRMPYKEWRIPMPIGHWSLVICDCCLVTIMGDWWLVIGHWSLVIDAGCLLIGRWSLFIDDCWLVICRCSLAIVHWSFAVVVCYLVNGDCWFVMVHSLLIICQWNLLVGDCWCCLVCGGCLLFIVGCWLVLPKGNPV